MKLLLFFFSHLITLGVLPQSQTIINSSKKFEIVYLADGGYASNELWLQKIKNDWKATAVNLRIFRFVVDGGDNLLNWNIHPYEVDDAIKKITDAGLNIYLRVNFANLSSIELNKYTNNDYQMRSNGKRFLNHYIHNKPILNTTSQKSRDGMLNFLSKLVDHLKTFPVSVQKRIKLIVPSLSPDDETEFTAATYDSTVQAVLYYQLTGFSNPEKQAFMQFLKNKYGSINKLNESWSNGANFSEFDTSQIQIWNYNWDGIQTDSTSQIYYKYVKGRKDFLDFRREELKRFIDDCSRIVKDAGFNFGAQFGCLYDAHIEFSGIYDPTPLIENLNLIITDEVAEYYPNFQFAADYSRSLCNYSKWKNNNKSIIGFATETNWPGYGGFNPGDLIKYWSLQLSTFYNKGASCLFVSHWGTIDSPGKIPEKVISGELLKNYKAWRDTLDEFQDVPVKIITNDFAYNLSCDIGLKYIDSTLQKRDALPTFRHNEPLVIDKLNENKIVEFPLNRFSRIKADGKSTNQKIAHTAYNGKGDFVTDYMLEQSPEYVKKNYNYFYLTATSRYMPEKTKKLIERLQD